MSVKLLYNSISSISPRQSNALSPEEIGLIESRTRVGLETQGSAENELILSFSVAVTSHRNEFSGSGLNAFTMLEIVICLFEAGSISRPFLGTDNTYWKSMISD